MLAPRGLGDERQAELWGQVLGTSRGSAGSAQGDASALLPVGSNLAISRESTMYSALARPRHGKEEVDLRPRPTAARVFGLIARSLPT
jgi:hypothetical protein